MNTIKWWFCTRGSTLERLGTNWLSEVKTLQALGLLEPCPATTAQSLPPSVWVLCKKHPYVRCLTRQGSNTHALTAAPMPTGRRRRPVGSQKPCATNGSTHALLATASAKTLAHHCATTCFTVHFAWRYSTPPAACCTAHYTHDASQPHHQVMMRRVCWLGAAVQTQHRHTADLLPHQPRPCSSGHNLACMTGAPYAKQDGRCISTCPKPFTTTLHSFHAIQRGAMPHQTGAVCLEQFRQMQVAKRATDRLPQQQPKTVCKAAQCPCAHGRCGRAATATSCTGLPQMQPDKIEP